MQYSSPAVDNIGIPIRHRSAEDDKPHGKFRERDFSASFLPIRSELLDIIPMVLNMAPCLPKLDLNGNAAGFVRQRLNQGSCTSDRHNIDARPQSFSVKLIFRFTG